ncbi:MAG TPA: (deoxy)nucleoside triphosphate pyrophosphohydrolase [Limosilactobacillus oris]|uniref:(deoxy)nucleoside triphosphate pyrophosphohydrolase n=1 Tax=Limosilactobacillus oris TaxID=1632 RepID=UPI001DBA69AA|nr:(deoxy)nucleoside triphosphate pyrophosphohydrolase [Limosilactobacillus oris]HJF47052.1 (deoxy)nucleoside triphosphate pyrophosphohydrolase [Limosilactobacillus oris]
MTKVINVVGAAILNENYQVLTTKRNDNRVLGTLWEFPGGKIESGERAQDALKRELQEEFNDQIEVGPLAAPVSVHQYDFGEIHLAVYYAKMDTHNFDLVAHSKVKWCRQAELMQLHWAAADLPIATQISQANLREIVFNG